MTSVEPVSATADHVAKAPGNQQRFTEFAAYVGLTPGCSYPALSFTEQADWAVSNPVNVSISSAKDETNGLATCVGATEGRGDGDGFGGGNDARGDGVADVQVG